MVIDWRNEEDRKRWGYCEVLLNGHPVPDVFYVDTEKGVVRQYMRIFGMTQLTPDRKEIRTNELHGLVTVIRIGGDDGETVD